MSTHRGMIMGPLALALAAAIPASASAQSEFYAEAPPFTIHSERESHACSMANSWQHRDAGTIMLIVLESGEGEDEFSSIAFTIEESRKPAGESGTQDLAIYFLDNDGVEIDAGWGEREFIYQPDGELGKGHLFLFNFYGDQNRTQAMADISNSKAVSFYMDGELLAAMPLEGAGPAVELLKECAANLTTPQDGT
ncbi:hypothetical protein [Paraurantiacibacter namhicola]|uniref:NosL n=1 Tax=Paraurantiacibacter namhicola TaxID=645517 RepID=A0A1C7D7V7_9SPHN|nr:hypothetical protein [Paraurantiacibacter namhicola]ANU07538.1 hypothetical protein A6F65_01231 [Paraurantiacibacter namhicola]